MSFPDDFAAAIERKLGAGTASTLSIEQLQVRLGLTGVSRETLRKVLREKHTPRRNVQAHLLSQVNNAPADPTVAGEPDYCGPKSAHEIRSLLSGSFFKIDSVPDAQACELVVTQLGDQRILLRCLDDLETARPGLTSEEYYAPLFNHLTARMDLLGVERGLLITHTEPSPRAKRVAEALKIVVENYDTFVRSVVDLPSVLKSLNAKLQTRHIDSDRFLSLFAKVVTHDGDVGTTDSYLTLHNFLDEPGGLAVATILGSYGSGKTSLALRLAHDTVQRSIDNRGSWVLPLWLRARVPDLSNPQGDIEPELLAALRALAPNTHIGGDTLRRLLRSGQAWLFVDGLDEAIALRSLDRLHSFLRAICDYCAPHGRIVLSVRQEVFDTRQDELALLESYVRDVGGAQRTLLLRMQPMELPQVEHVLKGFRPNEPSFANRLLAELRENQALVDLATRPIFLNIIANAGELPREVASEPSAILHFFESYVTAWSDKERRRTVRLDLASEQRLQMCEFMALYIAQYGGGDGISANEIRMIARDRQVPLTIPNVEAFVMEARVAMFLERDADSDKYTFSHRSLLSFFLARRMGKALARYPEPRAAADLEYFPLSKHDPVLRAFLFAQIRNARRDPLEILERLRLDAVHGAWSEVDPQWQPPFRIGPCFSYLVPNVAALLFDLREQDGTLASPVDLSGAHLAAFNLDDIWGQPRVPILLRSANLEGASFAGWVQDQGLDSIPPGDAPHRDVVRRYCDVNGLFTRSRFAPGEEGAREFVLIPNGTYEVLGQKQERDGAITAAPMGVAVRSYLIQRYPVTNRQFAAFLRHYPQFRPETMRREIQNDWYLELWPKTEDDPRWRLEDWLDAPIVRVTWTAAAAFAAAAGLRLPTEVEWEIASRYTGAGSTTLAARPWQDRETHPTLAEKLSDWAVFADDPKSVPASPQLNVYKQVPGAFRAWAAERDDQVPYFMVDYVREWVADYWSVDYPCVEPSVQKFSYLNDGLTRTRDGWRPHSADAPPLRVVRGGSYRAPADHATSSYRVAQPPLNANPDGGFRCVKPLRVTVPLGKNLNRGR